LQVHVEQRPAYADGAGHAADVVAPARKGRDDPEPVRVGQRRQDPQQLVAGDPGRFSNTILFHL
jgi:hypothetical protein